MQRLICLRCLALNRFHLPCGRRSIENEPMSQAGLSLSRNTGIRRPMARQDKRALVISALVFFAAVGVIAWFGITGFQPITDDDGQPVPQLIYAGGAPTQASLEEVVTPQAEEPMTEDEYVIGQFGDPVDELYADERGDDWGETALDRASRLLSGTDEGGRGRSR